MLCFPRILIVKHLRPKFCLNDATPQNKSRTKNLIHPAGAQVDQGTQVHQRTWISVEHQVDAVQSQAYSCGLTSCPELGETIIETLVIRLFSWIYIFSNRGGREGSAKLEAADYILVLKVPVSQEWALSSLSGLHSAAHHIKKKNFV